MNLLITAIKGSIIATGHYFVEISDANNRKATPDVNPRRYVITPILTAAFFTICGSCHNLAPSV